MLEEPLPPLNNHPPASAEAVETPAALTPAPPEGSEPGERLDEVIPRRDRPVQPVIGLGGSAGSLSALRGFFAAMPADSGLAFAVVVHLLPDRDSNLAALLQPVTAMPVVQVREAVRVEPNRVYVIPPAKQLSLADGQLRISNLEAERGRRAAVDLFFRTLADTIGPQGAAIILSGANGDGAIGLKRVKERGGLTIAQEPSEAEHDGMPWAAIATGMVDWVLPVTHMPERLLASYRQGGRLRLPAEEPPRPAAPAAEPSDAEAALREVLAFLRARTGHDFSDYKRATVLRRLARRLQVNGLEDLPTYLQFLRTHPGEAGALLQDLLISVTNFFRDAEAFGALETQLPRLFTDKKAEDSVRVWVAGCATGEEAYSVAMLLAEQAARLGAPPSIQVFATDLDEAALRAAREGLYTETIAADVSEERLRGFFVPDHGRYRVTRALREAVLFAKHDLLKDAPFSHLDLVSCRNLLIYLNRAAQRRALELFYFALKPGGRLFLGSAETVDEGAGALFRPLDKKHRLYARGTAPQPVVPVLSGGPSSLTQALERRALPAEPSPAGAAEALTPTAGRSDRGRAAPLAEAHLRLRAAWAPASVLIDPEDRIAHLAGGAERYLQWGSGEATLELLRVVHPGLRSGLRRALFRARQTGEAVEVTGVPVELAGGRYTIDLHVRPAPELGPGFLLVAFEGRPEAAAAPTGGAGAEAPSAAEPLVRQLEAELDQLKLQQRATIEEYEASLEELKSSNEELQAINEELRSATEEVETGREELQSINEELSTVNQELKHRVDELGRTNSDLQNLMASTDIATIFLDRTLRIQRYTPAAVKLFSLIPADLGRPLADLSHRLEHDFVVADAQRVLETLVPIEREKRSREGRWYLARLLPYRTTDDRIAGVALTFVDISARKTAETELLALKNALDAELAAMRRLHELSTRLLTAGPLQPLLEEVLEAAMGLQGADFGHVQLLNRQTGALEIVAQRGFGGALVDEAAAVQGRQAPCNRALERRARVLLEDVEADPAYAPYQPVAAAAGFRAAQATPLFDRAGQPLGVLSMHFRRPHRPSERELRLTDLYARQAAEVIGLRQAEEALRASEERLRRAAQIETVGIIFFKPDGRITGANNAFLRMSGYSREDLEQGRVRWDELTPPEWMPASRQALAEFEATGRTTPYQKEYVRPDGTRWWALFAATRIGPDEGVEYVLDISAQRRAEERLRASEERLRLILESARDFAIFTLDAHNRISSWNPGAEAIFGHAAEEAIDQSGELIFTPEDRAAGQPQREREVARREGRAEDERWHLRKDGRRFWASGVLTPMADPAGQVTGFLKILRDRTEVHQAEQARRQAEQRFALLARAVRDYAIFLLDSEGRVTHWNEGAARVTGYAEAEVLGRHVSLFYPPEQVAEDRPQRQLQEAAARGRSHEENWRVRKGGERFWAEELIVPLRDEESGALLGFAKICRDLTERKAAEDERARLLESEQAARQTAEAADRAKDRFLAALSHELRTPLAPVQLALFNLQHEEQLSPAGRETVAMIGRNLEVERQLIDDLLDVSRIVHGKLELRPEPVDLHGCVRAALEVCRSVLGAKGLQVSLHLDAANPTLGGEEARLQQVFWNLLQNAAKFTPPGGTVTVRSKDREGGGVTVEVADTGAGIAPGLLAKLFDPFEQGSAEAGRRHGGLGLGLAICQGIVQAHGGRIGVDSAGPGQGATFTVDLPAWPPEPTPRPEVERRE